MTDADMTCAVCATFEYAGEPVSLVPGAMIRTGGGIYEKTLPDGLTAVLTIDTVADGAWTQLLSFEHRGEKISRTIGRIRSFDRVFATGGAAVYESLNGDSCGADSFMPVKRSLVPGEKLGITPKGGRSSDTTAFPFFDIGSPLSSYTFGIGWSGQWILDLEADGDGVRVSAGLAETETVLRPGERIRTASMFWVRSDDVISSRRRFRRLMADVFAPLDPDTGSYARLPVAETNFDRYFKKRDDWATTEGQKRCVDAAVACGMDTLWLDAAWFSVGFPGGVGDLAYAPGFPNGTGEVADYAHKKGLRYLQWFEPERANAYSDTVRMYRDDVIVPDGRGSVNCLVNIGDERVRRRVTDLIKKHIRDDRIDVYRQDFNICPLGYWRAADEPDRKGMTEIRFVEGLYAMWDEIRAEFPHVLIDNCASGGRRIDLETCRRSVPLWRSDIGCGEEDEKSRPTEWSQNIVLSLSRYLPYHSSGCWKAEPYFMRSVFAGGVACNFDVFAPDFDAPAAARVVGEAMRLRKYWYGDFTPLTEPTNAEDVFAAWQLSLPGSGAVWVFRRKDCPEDVFDLSLSDIDEDSLYRVAVTDESLDTTELTLSGARLKQSRVKLPRRRSSAVVEYSKITENERG